MNSIDRLNEMIEQAESVVFFGGAGVSTESGIPDFRSVDGLYNQEWKYPPETIISRSFFDKNTAEFYRFYRAKLNSLGVKPNAAHLKLAELETAGKVRAVVTQNIDGLHQLAGSRIVYELHGSVLRNYCMNCGKFYSAEAVFGSDGIPRCNCGGIVKPDVVLYEEELDDKTVQGAIDAIARCDLLMIGGTSLNVYPAAGLIRYFRGKNIVIINRSPTPYDSKADLVIPGKIGEALSGININ
ncbi:MAG: NAD-dependent protein deacylase [Ruminococcus sp.]|nr:NAD-dependent protein deacylase [Ruminococcus sp.]